MSMLLLSTLSVVCPACEELNPPGTQRCKSCSGPLYATAAPAVAPSIPTVAPIAAPARPPAAAAVPAKAAAPAVPPAKSPADAIPPGMKPTARPAAPVAKPVPAAPAVGPIPASELVRKPTSPNVRAHVPAATPAPSAAAAAVAKFSLTVLAGPARGQRFRLPASGASVGRSKGVILFPEDLFVSPQHATFLTKEGKLFVRDEASASGVYVSISQQEAIAPQTFFSAGQRLFRYLGALERPTPPPGRPLAYGAPPPDGILYGVEEILMGGRPARTLTTTGTLFTVGQVMCDFSFPHEEGLTPRHVELTPAPTQGTLKDVSGGAGVFVKIRPGTERPLKVGDRLRIGQQVLQVEAGAA